MQQDTGSKKTPRDLPDPGGPSARARGCICSPERNNDGHGVQTAKGRTFYPNNDCPLHGLEATMATCGQTGRQARSMSARVQAARKSSELSL